MKKSLALQQFGSHAQASAERRARRRASRPDTAGAAGSEAPSSRGARLRRFVARHERSLLLVAGALLSLLIVLVDAAPTRQPRPVTQEDIDAAVLHTLETKPLPSRAAKAYEAVRRSVVRVHGTGYAEGAGRPRAMEGIGTGVVIVDKGIILTNLHVVAGAERIKVVFADGIESEATVIGAQPEHDLAVLQGEDDSRRLPAATLRSTADLGRRRRGGRGRLSVRHRPVGVGGRGVRPAPRVPLAQAARR